MRNRQDGGVRDSSEGNRRRKSFESLGGNDELSVSVAAHAIDSAGGASSDGICVASGMLCGDRDGAIRAADDGPVVIEGVCGAEIDDEASVL